MKKSPIRSRRKKKVGIVSLGCPKNQVDSEKLLGTLRNCTLVNDVDEADTIVVNTCGFIEPAKRESVDTILEAVRIKKAAGKEGTRKEVIVTGCLSERYREDLKREIPEVDAFFGVNEYLEVAERISGHYQENVLSGRVFLNDSHYAYVKISEGCNQKCSFCYIPMIRGRLRSRTVEEIVAETNALVSRGVKELILVSQDTSSYGRDLHGKDTGNSHLTTLLGSLCKVDGLEWIRVMYLYPTLTTDDYWKFVAAEPKVCNYVDMPIQHVSDSLLKSMKRGISKARTIETIEKIRRFIPDGSLRTSVIVGYPGETDREFEELADFVRQVRFDRLGVFTYSHEEGTTAFELEDDVPAKVKQERHDHLMELQQEISQEKNEARIGAKVKVLIDSPENDYFVGRTEYDAPEIDNEVIVQSGRRLEAGSFVEVEVHTAYEYDLVGNIVGQTGL